MASVLRVAMYAVDPPGLTLYRSFDPETNSIASLIAEPLVVIGAEGDVLPGLATGWQRVSPTELEFTLREGVRFHNGEPFDADSVVATFESHFRPTPSAMGAGVLSIVKAVHKLDDFRVRFETHKPDAMLLRRLFMLSIYPKGVLEKDGRDSLDAHPVGAGAYRFSSYERGRELVLERDRDHWANAASVDVLRFPILRQKEWLYRLSLGQIDVALNLDSHDCVRAERLPGVHGVSREAEISQWFLLSQRGPLADVRVRRALNHAVNRRVLVDLAEHGFARPQRGVSGPMCEGHSEQQGYRYSPELARRLLAEAGCSEGFELNGLVSENSAALFFGVREFLQRIGVRLNAEVMPRGDLLKRLTSGKIAGRPYQGDFVLVLTDNPILHTLFLQFVMFFSHGPGSVIEDAEYDALFMRAATGGDSSPAFCAEAERYHRDNALMLHTLQQHVHAAHRDGVHVVLPRSGHFNATAFWNLRVDDDAGIGPDTLPPTPLPPTRDIGLLLQGSSSTDTFQLPQQEHIEEATAQRIWVNLLESEQRWRMQNEPVLRELVNSLEARTNLANVLSSTERVGIVGHSVEGRLLFKNRGYDLLFGEAGPAVYAHLGGDGAHGWPAIRETVQREGNWAGPVHVDTAGRPPGAPEHLFLAVSPARDEEGLVIGYTFVFSDFSGEEERIRSAATRTILENVPYGLFMVGRDGCMHEGYSDACRQIFKDAGAAALTGRRLTDLLQMDADAAANFEAAFEQVVDDVLPAELTLEQLPARIELGERTFSLRGSIVYDAAREVSGVLFTMDDISALVAAEGEAEHHRATVLLMRYRDTFEAFARRLLSDLRELGQKADESDAHQLAIRAALHTAKGVFGQFSLLGLASEVHRLEDEARILPAHLLQLREDVVTTLREHEVDLDGTHAVYQASDAFLKALEQRVAQASSLDQARTLVHDAVDELRSHGVGALLEPIARAAQEQAARRDKRVRVHIIGGDERVPEHLMAMVSSLVHLTRNAMDHGIEAPDERGDKDPTATLSLEVRRSGAMLEMRISDDGRGIDAELLSEKAIRLGKVLPCDAYDMTHQQKLELIYQSGLSTRDQVTETSGRGVGAGATKAEVEAVGGQIAVRSTLGEGTTFVIRVPLRRPSAADVAAPALSAPPPGE